MTLVEVPQRGFFHRSDLFSMKARPHSCMNKLPGERREDAELLQTA